jgi:spore coat polysaccharide biosynthesis predicted glycosyltransferase SpsG
VSAPDGLSDRLASAGAAVVAGGVTLCEACALGTPAVAVPVVRAQRRAVAAAASAGAAIAVLDASERDTADRVATHIARILTQPSVAAGLSRRARRLVDGHGAARVASRIRALLVSEQGGWRHAA